MVEVLDELAEGFAGLVGAVENPLFHAQEVLQGFRVIQGVDQAQVFLAHELIRLQVEEGPVEHLAGNIAQGIHHQIDVDLLHPVGQHVVRGLEVDRGHHRHQILHFLRVQRRVTQGEGAALANAEEVDFVDVVAFADHVHATVEVAVDVVVQGEVAVGAIRVAPIHQIDILAGGHQPLHGGSIFLDVSHVGPVHQGVDDEQGCFALHPAFATLGGRVEAEQSELVLLIDHGLGRDAAGNLSDFHEIPHTVREFLAIGHEFLHDGIRAHVEGHHLASPTFLPRGAVRRLAAAGASSRSSPEAIEDCCIVSSC